jgi:uncharacterized membrane protein YgdD (TMEM256/DUF423 family)
MERTFVLIGSVLMFLGVGAGAFGAHGLAGYFEEYPELAETFDTAVRYQLIHGLGVLLAAWATSEWPESGADWAGILFLVGVLLFSGSLYLLVFTRISWLGAITPFGGIAFLGGWASLFVTAWRGW